MDPESESSLLGLSGGVNPVASYNDSDSGAQTTTSDYFHSAVLGVFLGLLCVVTAGMNLLVLYAVKREKSLHTVGNLYIVSLSVADLIVGVSVMPLNVVYILEDEWRLGHVACQFWLIMDYVASTASIFSLFILCVDRYRSVRQPLRYLKYRTRGRASAMISGAWLLSLMWIIPILGWRSFAHVDLTPEAENTCDTDFRFVTWFKVVTAIFNFYVPSILMLWFYTHIYLAVRRHLRERQRIIHPTNSFFNNRNNGHDNASPKTDDKVAVEYARKQRLLDQNTRDQTYCLGVVDKSLNIASKSGRRAGAKREKASLLAAMTTKQLWMSRKDEEAEKQSADSETPLNDPSAPEDVARVEEMVGDELYVSVNDCRVALPNAVSGVCDMSDMQRITSMLCNNNNFGQPLPWGEEGGDSALDVDNVMTLKQTWQRFVYQSRQRIQSLRIHKEHKAAKQLGFIIATFLMCWIPYFIAFMVMAFCQECVHHDLHMFTIWLGYINSTLNPFIYPLCNENFKRVFKNILHMPGYSRRVSFHGTTWGRQ